jgi:hypothetical protein
MWKQLTPADIQRARARAAALRREILIRHAEELRTLDANEAEIETLERFIIGFSERYLNASNGAGSAPADHIDVPNQSNSEQHTGPPRLEAYQQNRPNFGGPMRRWLRRS